MSNSGYVMEGLSFLLTIHDRGPGQWLEVRDGDLTIGEFISREWAERFVRAEEQIEAEYRTRLEWAELADEQR